MTTLKILVIDDKTEHRASAEELKVAGHEVTICGSYDKALDLLEEEIVIGDGGVTKSQVHYDLVLTDLLLPAGRYRQGGEGERLVGQEMPLGMNLALLAAVRGVPTTIVVSDKDHHSHPASAALDYLGGTFVPHEGERLERRIADSWLTVNGCRVRFLNTFGMKVVDPSKSYEEWVWVKDWLAIVNTFVL